MNELNDFFEIIAAAANTTTLYVNFKTLKIQYPIDSIKSALDDHSEIERIINSLFCRKQVMWERSTYEDRNWCINSLKDLREKCDMESDSIRSKSTSPNDKNQFLATLLRTLGSQSDEAYKDIVKLDMTGGTLDLVLRKFRKSAYPVVITFIYSLPGNNQIRQDALKKLEDGTKNTNLKIKQILPDWSVVPR